MADKIGQGALEAFLRQGHKELTPLLAAFPESNIRPVEEPGAMGNAVQMEVYDQKHPGPSYDDFLAGKAQAVSPERQPELDMDR